MKRPLPLVIVVVAGAAALYFARFSPRAVPAHRVSRGLVLEEALGSGSVESRQMVGVGFEVTARLAQLLVDQGDTVSAGQELARLDDDTFRAEVASAQGEVDLARSTLKRLEADIERARAVLEGAQSGLRRVTPLVEDGTASAEQLDVALEREKVAVAELARAEAALTEGQAGISVAQRRVERAQADLARTILLCPFDGTVVLREREVGDVAVPGSSILRLAAGDTIWSSVWVDEIHLASLRVGAPARVVLRSDPDTTHPGRVARIGREVDRQTRELLVDVAFEGPRPRIVLGQRVDVWIELSRDPETLRIPADLLVRSDGVPGVFVLQDGRARFRALELNSTGRGYIGVKRGLEAGELVLEPRSGKHTLEDGERVELSSVTDDPGNP
jgi:HlyD family secretion protein